jgi:hypothetical protein
VLRMRFFGHAWGLMVCRRGPIFTSSPMIAFSGALVSWPAPSPQPFPWLWERGARLLAIDRGGIGRGSVYEVCRCFAVAQHDTK